MTLPSATLTPRRRPGIAPHRLAHPEVGERQRVGQRRVGQRVGRGHRHRAGHVGDAVVGDAVDLVDRVAVGGRLRGLEAAALVDRDVDQHRALASSAPAARGGSPSARLAPWTSTAPITRSARGSISSIESVERVHGRGAAAEDDVELAQACRSTMSKTKTSASIPIAMKAAFMPTAPPPITITLRGGDPGHAAEQHAAAAERLLEVEGAGLGRELAGDLAHRRQQRQPALLVLDGLVGDAGRARTSRSASRQLGVRGEVEIGEERSGPGAASPTSGVCGSLTLRIISASPKTASASGRIFAPWAS